MESFDVAFATVVGLEGGYSNDPRDPGGETKYGVSKHAYPSLDIANLTLEAAKEVYFSDYWQPAGCADLAPFNALCVFDCAVNQGVHVAVKFAQLACGLLGDGVVGPKTRAAFAAMTPQQLAKFMAYRAMHYVELPTYQVYGRGWLNRLFELAIPGAL